MLLLGSGVPYCMGLQGTAIQALWAATVGCALERHAACHGPRRYGVFPAGARVGGQAGGARQGGWHPYDLTAFLQLWWYICISNSRAAYGPVTPPGWPCCACSLAPAMGRAACRGSLASQHGGVPQYQQHLSVSLFTWRLY